MAAVEQCQNCKTPAHFIFVYPECDLVCRKCGSIQADRSNFIFSVDPLLKQPKRLDDYGGRSCAGRLSTCDYHPRCDINIYRRSRAYAGYLRIFHYNELVALPGLRPPIPEKAIPFILDGAKQYYSEEAHSHKSFLGTAFSHADAREICERAAQLFERYCQRRRISQPKPRRGEREVVNAFRIRSYSERWVQIWRILLGEMCDPKLHPVLPWPLEERVRIRGSILVRLWLKYCFIPKHREPDNELQSHNCRFAMFIRAVLCVEGARTSIRRVFPLTGIQEDKWYRVLCFLWTKLPEEGCGVYLNQLDCVIRVDWPMFPPPLCKIQKNEPTFSSKGCYKMRWYEATDIISVYHDKLEKRRCQMQEQNHLSWQPYC